jgi:hypothetical protein
VVTVVRRWGAVALLLLITACGTPDRAAGPPGPVPFADFVAGVQRARYGDYAGRPGTEVRSEAAFEEMRRYLLDRYATARVSHSYAQGDATFDCVGSGGPAPSGSACPPGSVPVRRVTLAELVHFPTLQSFLGKDPGGGGLPPVPSKPR